MDELTRLIAAERRVLEAELGSNAPLEHATMHALHAVTAPAFLAAKLLVTVALAVTVGTALARSPPHSSTWSHSRDAAPLAVAVAVVAPLPTTATTATTATAAPTAPIASSRVATPSAAIKAAVVHASAPVAATTRAQPGDLAAYDAAMALLRAQRFHEAAVAFAQFAAAFPASALAPEAELSHLDALYRDHDYAAAVALAIASNERGGERAGEVARVEGDALVKLGACERAAFSYRDAVARGIALDVEAALASCR